jgi:acetylglutamate/LysW-gamma-L-alpha-aminoadipate kinase
VGQNQQVIVVHGGSAETNEISEKLGFPPRFVTNQSGFTSRYTDRTTLEIFAMVTNGRINTLLVERLQKSGVNAIGLSGLDARLMIAKRKDAIRIVENGKNRMLRDDFTGKIETVNGDFLKILVNLDLTPVISPLAMSPDGIALNVDADRAAAMVAGAVGADELIILTNVPGLMSKVPDESTLIPHIAKSGLEQALSFAEGRMKKKVLGASEALNLGVSKIVFADGRVENPLQKALQGTGTVIS